ncbi:MAG: diguanylate cyclase [Acidobacteria bacterium]|nr:diguanylate cyclase [Acidobacteriota bacterium]
MPRRLAFEDTPTIPELPGALVDARVALSRFEYGQAEEAIQKALLGVGRLPPAVRTQVHFTAADSAFRRNRYADARRFADLALEDARGLARAQALSLKGAALTQESRYQEALDALYEALAAFDEAGSPALAGDTLNYVAVVHEELGDWEEAGTMYARSLASARASGDRDLEGKVLANIGEGELSRGLLTEAEAHLGRAHEIFSAIGNTARDAWCLATLARIAEERGADAEAGRLLGEALAAAEKGGVTRTHAEVLVGLGTLLARRGDEKAALTHLRWALALLETSGIRREIFKTHEALSATYARFGRFEEALHHHREFHRVRSEVFDDLARVRLERLKARYEVEKVQREREIEQLRSVELARAYDELARLNGELRATAMKLADLAIHDALTGVYNRRHLDAVLPRELSRAVRTGSPLSVAMVDLDHFKDVNDRFSHALGDEVLVGVARLAGQRLRKSDLVARYGGEEFVLLLPDTPLEEAIALCEKLREAFEGQTFGEHRLKVTASIGVASSQERNDAGAAMSAASSGAAALLALADERLYEAKRSGRNRVRPELEKE